MRQSVDAVVGVGLGLGVGAPHDLHLFSPTMAKVPQYSHLVDETRGGDGPRLGLISALSAAV